MTCTIDATVGGVNSNSFASVTESDTYHNEERLPDPDYDTASSGTKCRALKQATRLLVEQIEWKGEVATDEQALPWPRTGMLDHLGREIASDVIPQALKNATSELAGSLIDADGEEEVSSDGITKLEVGSIKVAFSESNPPKRQVIPEQVMEMIAPWVKSKRFGNTGTVRLIRT